VGDLRVGVQLRVGGVRLARSRRGSPAWAPAPAGAVPPVPVGVEVVQPASDSRVSRLRVSVRRSAGIGARRPWAAPGPAAPVEVAPGRLPGQRSRGRHTATAPSPGWSSAIRLDTSHDARGSKRLETFHRLERPQEIRFFSQRCRMADRIAQAPRYTRTIGLVSCKMNKSYAGTTDPSPSGYSHVRRW
jgi:hypothetical protein